MLFSPIIGKYCYELTLGEHLLRDNAHSGPTFWHDEKSLESRLFHGLRRKAPHIAQGGMPAAPVTQSVT